jgi:hypothetical protein
MSEQGEALNIVFPVKQRVQAVGRRRYDEHHGQLCSCCLKNPPASDHDRYCKKCRAGKQREHRQRKALRLKQAHAGMTH